MRKIIPYGRQNITEADIKAVVETLQSDVLTQGPKIAEFENAFAKYIGCKYAVAVSNGTAALHISTLALEVKPGDKVITTPITFVASANCVRYCGGEIVFADIDPDTYLLDINAVRKLLKDAPRGTYKGIIPVNLAGHAVNLEAFKQLADEYGCWIIEDACHAPGGYFTDTKGNKQNCGNGNFANLAVFSFHPVKHIACGEGGMVTTNDEELYKKLLILRTHGITREMSIFKNSLEFASGTDDLDLIHSQLPPDQYPLWYMEMQMLGYNYRLTDFQAALGTSQLARANEGIERRRAIAKKYNERFNTFTKEQQSSAKPKKILGHSGEIEGHAYHLYIIEVENRLALYNYLRTQNIYAQIHYIPAHLMPNYRQLGWKERDMPNAENYYKHCISLPMYPTLTDEEQEFVITEILNFIQ